MPKDTKTKIKTHTVPRKLKGGVNGHTNNTDDTDDTDEFYDSSDGEASDYDPTVQTVENPLFKRNPAVDNLGSYTLTSGKQVTQESPESPEFTTLKSALDQLPNKGEDNEENMYREKYSENQFKNELSLILNFMKTKQYIDPENEYIHKIKQVLNTALISRISKPDTEKQSGGSKSKKYKTKVNGEVRSVRKASTKAKGWLEGW